MALIEGEVEEIITSSIDKCLDSVGRGFRDIFYWSLENRVGIKRSQIVERPEEFAKYVDRMFTSSSPIIKDEMIGQIAFDLGIPRTTDRLDALIRRARNDLN